MLSQVGMFRYNVIKTTYILGFSWSYEIVNKYPLTKPNAVKLCRN